MTASKLDTRLSISPYREVIERTQTQFDLLRYALSELSERKKKNFFKGRASQEMQSLHSGIQLAKLHISIDQNWEELVMGSKARELRRKTKPGERHLHQEVSEDRLNQSELLLLVAHFESF